MVEDYGFASLGIALSTLALGALLLIRNKPSVPVIRGERLRSGRCSGGSRPRRQPDPGVDRLRHLTTFVTLFYLSRGWTGAAYCLTVFGTCFILARLFFIGSINRFGGFRAAIVCMSIETLGLVLLWLAPSTGVALAGAGLAGFGLSLVYPALGVEAIKQVPSTSRGAGLSAYAVFFDLALAIAGPVMGAVASNLGYSWIFFTAALLSVSGLSVTVLLARRAAAH